MSLHDFACPHCGAQIEDYNVPASVGATAGAPCCPNGCGLTDWIPKIRFIDAKEPFQRFEVTDGRGLPVVVDSLHRLRQIERDSERDARNGLGQQMVWRDYSQDRSNTDQHTLSTDLADPHGVAKVLAGGPKTTRGEKVTIERGEAAKRAAVAAGYAKE